MQDGDDDIAEPHASHEQPLFWLVLLDGVPHAVPTKKRALELMRNSCATKKGCCQYVHWWSCEGKI